MACGCCVPVCPKGAIHIALVLPPK
ncbi:MAG: hypothetical protein ACLSCV_07535 [Acutalibacteraceae bacterium]